MLYSYTTQYILLIRIIVNSNSFGVFQGLNSLPSSQVSSLRIDNSFQDQSPHPHCLVQALMICLLELRNKGDGTKERSLGFKTGTLSSVEVESRDALIIDILLILFYLCLYSQYKIIYICFTVFN